uniref:Ig-like domain-containing protein n=1 Tax=Labrus bergylta TaxID=56723 RepID=A0A3Q3EAX6_9LABR
SDRAVVTLQPHWTEIHSGEKITFRCEIEGGDDSEWEYEWETTSSDRSVRQSESFEISATSHSFFIFVYLVNSSTLAVANKAVVTLHPNWSEIYSEESITLRCEIKDGDDAEWEYEWKTSNSFKPPKEKEYSIGPAYTTHSGNYSCKGRKKSDQSPTGWSDPITLTVLYRSPQPVLTVSPLWLSPGDSVTLNCEVKQPSAGWRFYWYETHTAGYVCRAGRGEMNTPYSEPKFVWSGGQFVSVFILRLISLFKYVFITFLLKVFIFQHPSIQFNIIQFHVISIDIEK